MARATQHEKLQVTWTTLCLLERKLSTRTKQSINKFNTDNAQLLVQPPYEYDNEGRDTAAACRLLTARMFQAKR
eukprot:scaffold434347_cov18-Prasinocladus_malaysianus.AAC.1